MKTLSIPQKITTAGFKVPIGCAFTGVKFLPIIALTTNSAFPNLVLYDEHINYRVIRKSSAKYSSIEKADAVSYRFAQNLTLYFSDSIFVLTVQLHWREDLIELVKFFQRKGASITERTLNLMEINGETAKLNCEVLS